MFINCNGKLLSLDNPVVMGIVNITPDSFYKSSRVANEKELLTSCEKMLLEGASIIDVGGYSTRPGASVVSEEEEAKRVLNTIRLLTAEFKDIILSVDTFRSTIARQAIENGAAIINDISSGEEDEQMMQTIATLKVPYILMHKRGTPQTMTKLTSYNDVVQDVIDYFIAKIIEAKKYNICDIIIDPGFGFAKTLEQNYRLLNNLDVFKILDKPLLAGISRKKMIQSVINSDAEHSLNGTTSANTIALTKGTKILRVHDVAEAIECVKITQMLN